MWYFSVLWSGNTGHCLCFSAFLIAAPKKQPTSAPPCTAACPLAFYLRCLLVQIVGFGNMTQKVTLEKSNVRSCYLEYMQDDSQLLCEGLPGLSAMLCQKSGTWKSLCLGDKALPVSYPQTRCGCLSGWELEFPCKLSPDEGVPLGMAALSDFRKEFSNCQWK